MIVCSLASVDLDRFRRPLKHLFAAPADIDAIAVAFVSLKDNFDLSTPSGCLIFHIAGAMGGFERALIQERRRADTRNARAQGERIGRPYRIIDHERILPMRAEGTRLRQIAAKLAIGYGTVRKRLAAGACANPLPLRRRSHALRRPRWRQGLRIPALLEWMGNIHSQRRLELQPCRMTDAKMGLGWSSVTSVPEADNRPGLRRRLERYELGGR